jgi:3-hydroxybutyryl-CoA dehydrogenase
MKLVEVVQGPHVSDETAQISMALCSKLDKVAILIRKEVEGFCVGRIIGTIIKEALWMYEMGVASPEDIDKACVYGAGHPMGPFRLGSYGIDLEYVMKKKNS